MRDELICSGIGSPPLRLKVPRMDEPLEGPESQPDECYDERTLKNRISMSIMADIYRVQMAAKKKFKRPVRDEAMRRAQDREE